jgi:hypothetical protein
LISGVIFGLNLKALEGVGTSFISTGVSASETFQKRKSIEASKD